jgi:methyltransferase
MRLLVCAGMGGARVAELVYSRRNVRLSGPTSEGPWSRRTYPFIVAVHTVVIVGTAVRGRRKVSAPWLALLLAVQPLRVWVLVTLGRRWNTRAAVPSEMAVETGGPYAFVRHPNYAIIAVELFALPMAFGLRRLAVVAALANATALAPRIREEEAALRALPGWAEHFSGKKRFVQRVF